MSNETTPERSPQTEPQPAAPAAEQPAAEAPKRRRTAKKAAPAPEAAAELTQQAVLELMEKGGALREERNDAR